MKPNAYLRCKNCYATGYVVKSIESQTVTGRLTNKKCISCNGSGYIII